jgi:hypothetical protein
MRTTINIAEDALLATRHLAQHGGRLVTSDQAISLSSVVAQARGT